MDFFNKERLNQGIKDTLPKGGYEGKSGWISPTGLFFEVAFSEHETFAGYWIEANDPEYDEDKHYTWLGFLEEKVGGLSPYAHEYLENKGWTRLMYWASHTKSIQPEGRFPKNNKAAEHMFRWAIDNNFTAEWLKI